MGLIYQAYFKTNGKSYIDRQVEIIQKTEKEHLQASKDKPYLFIMLSENMVGTTLNGVFQKNAIMKN